MMAFLHTTEEVILFAIALAIISSPAWVGFFFVRSILKKLERKANLRF